MVSFSVDWSEPMQLSCDKFTERDESSVKSHGKWIYVLLSVVKRGKTDFVLNLVRC